MKTSIIFNENGTVTIPRERYIYLLNLDREQKRYTFAKLILDLKKRNEWCSKNEVKK